MAEFGKLNFSVSFNPTSAFPLDARYYFDSYDAAVSAATGAVEVGLATGTYFIGEELVVVENDKATLYIIQPDKTLSAVGTSPIGDTKSVVVAEDGTISLKGIEGLSFTDEDGNAIQYQPLMTASGLTWVVPSATTVEGLDLRLSGVEKVVGNAESGLVKDVADLQATVGDASNGLVKEVADVKANLADNYYDKAEVDGLVAGAFHFKGAADSMDEDGDLVKDGNKITDQKQGDVYQVGDKEYAWNGESWTELGFTIDLSNYATVASVSTAKSEAIAAAATDATTKSDAALASAKTYTNDAVAGLGIGDYAKTTEVESAISAAKTELQTYADQAETDAIATAGTNADTKIAAKVGEIGDTTVKAYVDNKETVINNSITDINNKIENLGGLARLNEVGESNLTTDLATKINNKADKATTLAGYGITDAYTQTEINDKLSATDGAVKSNTEKLADVTGTVGASITSAKDAAVAAAKSETETQINALKTGEIATNTQNIAANATAIATINNADTGILAQANKHTDDSVTALKNGEIKANADAITALADGQVATNKSDIATLSTRVGTVETTVTDGLAARYTKTEADEAIAKAIADVDHLKREVVENLPEASAAADNTIYMVKDESVEGVDKYREYMLIDGALVLIGDTSVDLSGYAEKTLVEELATKLNGIENNAEANIIEIVKANGVALEVNAEDRSVNLPAATAEALGLVKVDNDTIVANDGVISVNSIGISKVYIEDGTELILNGGKASV